MIPAAFAMLFFVGALWGIAVFLVAYNGYDRADGIITNIAGVCTFGVSLCPTTPGNPAVHQVVIGDLHLTFACVAFTLLAVMALSDFGKPFAHHEGVGFVFFGARLSGTPNLIVAPIFGILLSVYVYGIFAMRRFAWPLGIFYAAYVILNMPLFILRYHGTAVMQEHSWAYLVPYPFVAIGVSSGAAWLLYRRKSDLR